MHSYSIDNDGIRMKIVINIIIGIVIVICLIAKVLGYDLSKTINLILKWTSIVFLIVYYIFDKFIWKLKIFTKYHKISCLQGDWEGTFNSRRYDEKLHKVFKEKGSVKFTIKQTWSKIAIISNNEKSDSESVLAGIYINRSSFLILRYEYENRPKNMDVCLGVHYGCSNLKYDEEKKILEGDYFNDINRRTQGRISYKKVE